MSNIVETINTLSETIINEVTEKILEQTELDSYEIVWKQLQDIAAKQVKEILYREIPDIKIVIPKSKSTYPDIKIIKGKNQYAIDIKCSEIQKNPWYDMARLDTINEKRLAIYHEEWELLIQYDSETKKFLKCYFGLFREFVGYNAKCKGVKFRPYDGKVRPKTWDEFDRGIIYWNSHEDFVDRLRKSQIQRWKNNIASQLVPILSEDEKDEFINILKGITKVQITESDDEDDGE